jgi:alkanesulfonate monooxygenase SsuD/methylene tetrahydromethanopterin reductase-like flavin-dependent oxidoreductase (luciferase family)
MTRLAGAIADGVLFNTIISPEYMSAVLKGHLESGVEESNRDSYPVLCMNAVTVCTEDEAKAYAILKADLAMHIGVTTYWTEIARFHGFEKAYAAVEKSWHAGDYQRAADLVPDEAVEVFGLIGSPADIDKQLDRYRSLFDRVILAGPGFNASGESASAVYDGMLALFGSDYVD